MPRDWGVRGPEDLDSRIVVGVPSIALDTTSGYALLEKDGSMLV